MIGRRVRGPTLVSSCATGGGGVPARRSAGGLGGRARAAPRRAPTGVTTPGAGATAHLLIAVADDQCVEPALSVAAGDSHYLAASPWSWGDFARTRVIPNRAITSASREDIRREGSQKMALKILLATLIAVAILAPAAHAEPTPQNSDQNPVIRTVFDQPTNVPGKSLETVTVSYPPGAKSAAHHHAKSAFIMAYVISGAVRSQLEGEPARVYHAGETWSEAPGAHHTVSENASATEPAELLAVFLVGTGDGPLTTDDTAEK